MASQRQCFIFAFLMLFAFASTVDSVIYVDKVKLNLYYESLCPYSAYFIVKHLVKIFQTDLWEIVDLKLVPWGNAKISHNNTWICQHGVDECHLNAMQACAINVWPSETHFKFISCIENFHLKNNHTLWQSCFGETKLDWRPIYDCYANESFRLVEVYAYETFNLHPKHKFVPWVIVDDLPLEDDYLNFIAYVCKAYKAIYKPRACSLRNNLGKGATTPPYLQ